MVCANAEKALSRPTQDHIKRTIAAMARMGGADAGNAVGIAAGFKPMANLPPDRAAPRVAVKSRAFRWLSRNDKQDSRPLRQPQRDRLAQPDMGRRQRMAMQVDGHVRDQIAATDSAFPA